MIHLDLGLLAKHLAGAPSQNIEIPPEVNRYLVETLLIPTMYDKPVLFGDIDFDAFEESDLYPFEVYCGKISSLQYRVTSVQSSMARIRPVSLHQHTFC